MSLWQSLRPVRLLRPLLRMLTAERRCTLCLEPFVPPIPPAQPTQNAVSPALPASPDMLPAASTVPALSTIPPDKASAMPAPNTAPNTAPDDAPDDAFAPSGAWLAQSEISAASRFLCPRCRPLLRRQLSGFCPYCGEILPDRTQPPSLCAACACRSTPLPWDSFRFYGIYEGALRTLLLQAKFHAHTPSLALLSELLAEICHDADTDVILPIPLHDSRLRWRGYNQCTEISRLLSKKLQIPLNNSLLVRTRATPPQSSLHHDDRQRNITKAFAVLAPKQVEKQRILLVDDIATTNCTLLEAAQTLRDAGAKRIDVAVIAKAKKRQ